MTYAELPKLLQDALAESRESGKELQSAGVRWRYANSDEPRERVLSRTALAKIMFTQGENRYHQRVICR